MIGQALDHYRIESTIGEGGMGVVYRAHDTHLSRLMAIKVLRSSMAVDSERRRRFVQEAKAVSALNHPHIVQVYDISHAGDVDFIVMEYVEGRTLDRLIGTKACRAVMRSGMPCRSPSALATAHAAGIIHRDVKPSNIVVSESYNRREGAAKLLDFGLAKLREVPPGRSDHPACRSSANG